MHRGVALAALVGGCAFDPAGLEGGAPDATARDAAVDAARVIDATSDPDLVAAYRFESVETPMQPHDDTIYRNDGTSSGVVFIPGRTGAGLAMQFANGATVVVPDSASLDVSVAMTLEAWIYVSVYPATGGRMGILDDNGQFGLFLLPGGAVRCTIAPGFADRLAVPLATWTHIACTYDGAQMVMYQDGVASTPGPMTGAIATAGVDGLGIGMNLPSGENLLGALDDVRIWRVALTALQVQAEAAP